MKAIEEMEQKLESRSDGDGESSVVVISIPRSQEVEETKKESTWQMIAKYKSAVFWSSFVGLAGINWGMDVLLSNGVISIPSFQEDFGFRFKNQFIVSASWQIAFNSASSIGGFFGAIATGYLADRVGKRGTLGGTCVLSIGAVFIQVFAHKHRPGVLLTGKLLNGLALGGFLTIPSSYASEICPVQIRGFTTSGVQLFISIGQLTANLVLKGTGTLSSNLAYRIPFALQFIFPTILLIGLPFSPESPWFLLHKARPEAALATLTKLGYTDPIPVLAEMAHTVEIERKNYSSTTYLDCFKGINLRRTEIAMGIFTVAQLTGVVFTIGYSTYFFELAGLSPSSSFSLSVGVSVLGLIGVMGSWFLINRTGRRSTSLFGTMTLALLLLLIGILDIIPTSSRGPVYIQVACIIIFAFVYLLTIGPMGWALFAEISSAELRSRTVGLGIVVQSVFGVLLNIVVPLLINPDAANLGGKIGFIFAGTASLGCLWVWWRVPETRGRRLMELDWLFENKVPASKFQGYEVPL